MWLEIIIIYNSKATTSTTPTTTTPTTATKTTESDARWVQKSKKKIVSLNFSGDGPGPRGWSTDATDDEELMKILQQQHHKGK